MSKGFGVTELKEVVSELEKQYDQCQTCWPTTVFSQGSFTERKVFCCSKFLRADGDKRMSSPEENSGLFSGIRFVLAGFEPAYENQFIEELEANGGENAVSYDSSSTHVIVSNLAYDDPVCAAARKDGKALVTDAWVADCLDNDVLADVNSVLYRPLKDLDGIPGSEDLCICLTGYQGQARQKIMRMVELIGARFTKPLLGNLVTHLICYKFEGEKYELAKKTGLKLINHFWLEDCLKSWSLVPEANYSHSGWEVENEAKLPKIIKEKAEALCTPVSPKGFKTRTSISAEVPLPNPAEESSSRRDNAHSKARSPSAKVNSSSNSPVPNPSSVQKKTREQTLHGISQEEATVNPVAQQRKVHPNTTSLTAGVECNNSVQGSEFSREASKIPDKRDGTSPVHGKKSRRSSCGGPNQVSPVYHGVAVAADQCATIDYSMERMSISPESASKKRVSGVEGVQRSELNTSENAVETESPESKRRKSTKLSRLELSPSVRSAEDQDVLSSSPRTRQVSSPSVAPVSAKHKIKRKLSKSEKEIQQDAVPKFGAEAISGADVMAMEVAEASDFLTSPDNKRVAWDFKLQAVQSKQVYDASDDLCPGNFPTNDHVNHTADAAASRHADTPSSKDISRRIIQSSPPKSHAVEREVDMDDVGRDHSSVRKSKMTVETDGNSAPRARKSVNKSTGVHSKEKDEVSIDISALDEGVSIRDGPVKKSAKRASRVTLSPHVSSRELAADNQTRPPASQKIPQHNDVESLEHELPLESAAGKKSAKKSSKGDSSEHVPQNTSPQKTAERCFSDQHNQKSPSRFKKGTALGESSPEQQPTSAGIQVPVSLPKKSHESYRKDPTAASSRQKEKEQKNEGSRRKGAESNTSSRERSTTIEAQASLSQPWKGHKKKSRGTGGLLSDEQDKENVELQKSNDKVSCKAVAPRESCQEKGNQVSLLRTAVPVTKKCFAVGGSTNHINNLHYVIKLLGAKVCKSRYEWKDDITHVVLPVPLRRTEKFLAGAAAGRWILTPDYVEASRKAAKFVDEEEYEWFGEGTNDKGTVSLQAPRKWRTQYATSGCGAFYGMRVVVYGQFSSPPPDTLKRAIRAGGGFVLAAAPPYSQHLLDGVDFAIINPVSVQNDDGHVREFLKHEVACVTPDYFLDYICHPSSSLEKHILYKTNSAVEAAKDRLQNNILRGPTEDVEKLRRAASQKLSTRNSKRVQVADDIACIVCGRTDDEKVLLLCGDDKGRGCGLATHIHCCAPPLLEVPEEDWFCRNCEEL